MKPELFRMLKSAAEADKSKALLSLEILSENPAGIGDHSDIACAVSVEIAKIAAADDGLLVLEENFSDHIYSE